MAYTPDPAPEPSFVEVVQNKLCKKSQALGTGGGLVCLFARQEFWPAKKSLRRINLEGKQKSDFLVQLRSTFMPRVWRVSRLLSTRVAGCVLVQSEQGPGDVAAGQQ